jgi:drug/metabolite transporter (DMT)-like permease
VAVRIRVILAFASIFIVWGSTYLAIRYAVEEIPPLLTAAVRHVVAGAILLYWARSKGLRATSVEWRHSAVVGALFFLIGHGTLHWAEQSVPSGLSALLVATEPVWIAVLLALTGAARLRPPTIVGLVLGLGGVWLLVGDDTIRASEALLSGSVAILLGAASWALGVIYAQHAPMPANPTLRTATTLLCGSGWLLLASALAGEFGRVRVPSPLAIGSLAFLIVFGSILAFTAYYWLLDRYPATFVATHTYVNPAVAMLLGWAIAGEAVSRWSVLALVIIVGAIALVSTGPQPEREPHRNVGDGSVRSVVAGLWSARARSGRAQSSYN